MCVCMCAPVCVYMSVLSQDVPQEHLFNKERQNERGMRMKESLISKLQPSVVMCSTQYTAPQICGSAAGSVFSNTHLHGSSRAGGTDHHHLNHGTLPNSMLKHGSLLRSTRLPFSLYLLSQFLLSSPFFTLLILRN